jgi:hypothetical protein
MKYRQQRLESRGRRLGRILRRVFTPGYVKQQRAYRVELDGLTVKRLVVEDSHIAQQIASNLRAFEATHTVPAVIACFKNEIWVEYLEGSPVQQSDARLPTALAAMFARVYALNARRCDPRELGLDRELLGNLRFLEQAGVLQTDACTELTQWADATVPRSVWIGHDYTDPRPSNFLWNVDEDLLIIDIESLASDCLIGCGAAKALVSWMAPQRVEFLAELKRRCAPEFLLYFSFTELYFLARWHKRSVLHRKPWLVQPALFERFRRGGDLDTFE